MSASTDAPASVIYECPECEIRYLDERRCPDCNLFTRRIGPGIGGPHRACGLDRQRTRRHRRAARDDAARFVDVNRVDTGPSDTTTPRARSLRARRNSG